MSPQKAAEGGEAGQEEGFIFLLLGRKPSPSLKIMQPEASPEVCVDGGMKPTLKALSGEELCRKEPNKTPPGKPEARQLVSERQTQPALP